MPRCTSYNFKTPQLTKIDMVAQEKSSSSPSIKEGKQIVVAEAIANYLIEHGLENSGIRALAKAADISDRMLIYYFGNKDAAIAAALEFIAMTLAARLQAVIPGNNMSPSKLFEEVIAASSTKEFQPVIRLWFELVGYAVRGETPYQDSVRVMAENWQLWIEAKLKKSAASQAEMVFAQIEGKLMIDLLKS